MLNFKKILVILGFILFLNFVYAGSISVSSTVISQDGRATITLNADSYSNYLYFYKGENFHTAIGFSPCTMASGTCTGTSNVQFTFSASKFEVGSYTATFYSISENTWLKADFEIVGKGCSDGTFANTCSTTKPKYCSNGILIEKCSICGCSTNYGCYEEKCYFNANIPSGTGTSIKDSSFYSPKEVFLVSDENWKDILPFISISTWTDSNGNVQKYPFLIYHKTNNELNADSVIHFLQQYNPSRVTIIGESPQEMDNLLVASPELGAGLSESKIQRISSEDYFSYWVQFNKIVYVQQDYELSLLASVYASLINSPMIIERTSFDSPSAFLGRQVVCIGDVSPKGNNCSETYNLEQLQQKYFDLTQTDKVILINPNDIINYKNSLSAPILASAKQELILGTYETDYKKIDNFLEQKISQFSPDYLTIISAESFGITNKNPEYASGGYPIYRALDTTQYSDINNDFLPDIYTGRIMGMNPSDVSGYIARALFYNTFPKTNNVKFLASSFQKDILQAKILSESFRKVGYNSVAITSEEQLFEFEDSDWKNQDMVYYSDHGLDNWAGISSEDIPLLSNSILAITACLSCSYEFSFCGFGMRQGAIAYIGSVGVSFVGSERNQRNTVNEIYGDRDITLGEAFKRAFDYYQFHKNELNLSYMDTLLGDPTLVVNPTYLIEEELSVSQTCASDIDCKYLPVTDFYCSTFGNLRGFEFRCIAGICEPKVTFSTLVENCEGRGCSTEGAEAHCKTCVQTDNSCGDGACTNCAAMPPTDKYCFWLDGDLRGKYSRCDKGFCEKYDHEIMQCNRANGFYGCSESGGEAHCITAAEADTCSGTTTSCGFDSATGTCSNCANLPKTGLTCSPINGNLYGYNYHCSSDRTCVSDFQALVNLHWVQDCSCGCASSACRTCFSSGTPCSPVGNPSCSLCDGGAAYCSATGFLGLCKQWNCK